MSDLDIVQAKIKEIETVADSVYTAVNTISNMSSRIARGIAFNRLQNIANDVQILTAVLGVDSNE